MTRKIYPLIILSLIVSQSPLFSQSSEELGKRNGFKDIKMATDVTQYEGLEYNGEIEDEQFKSLSVYHSKKDKYQSIGSVKIHEVEVLAYKGEVYKIKVVTDKNPKLYGGLKKAFGKPTHSPRSNNYYWATDDLVLIYGSHSKNKLVLTYQSFVMERKLKQDKADEIDSISEDF